MILQYRNVRSALFHCAVTERRLQRLIYNTNMAAVGPSEVGAAFILRYTNVHIHFILSVLKATNRGGGGAMKKYIQVAGI
jgi:hypothetical protein